MPCIHHQTVGDYVFESRWQVEGTAGEVADVLGDFAALPRWWPSVYLDVWEVRPPDGRGLGRRVKTVTKGWLPYTMRSEFEVVESRYPNGFTIVATGDFEGRGVWTFEQRGPVVEMTYVWRLRAGKPLLRNLSFLLTPLFEANYRWAMGKGEESLALELARRRVTSDAARASVPAPPGTVTYAGVAILVGAAAVGAGLAYLIVRSRRPRRRTSGPDATTSTSG
jgi:Polyketide cyclase / dehydrase and lipid transport